MGEQLAAQAPVEADMVMGVPESGLPAAEGFARHSGTPFGHGLVKNRYIGRTFIAPSQEMRALGVRMKLNPLKENIEGQRLVVVDDSIVRGHHDQGDGRDAARRRRDEVHMRISSPPYRWPCFYGMDTGSRGELLAANMEVDEIRDYLGVDTLSYLTLDRLVDAVAAPGAGFCCACLTGEYPVEITAVGSEGRARHRGRGRRRAGCPDHTRSARRGPGGEPAGDAVGGDEETGDEPGSDPSHDDDLAMLPADHAAMRRERARVEVDLTDG